MSEAGQFQGSHAFTHINTSESESVNPNTGTLSVVIPLIRLAGIKPSIDLNVNLLYHPGSQGIFGLPSNWTLDLPYVLDGKSVTTNGRTYAIDLEWYDNKGHKSGLRYMNNHGTTFEQFIPAKPVPSGRDEVYSWLLRHPDGSAVYFDELGRPAERYDVWGNHIIYVYEPAMEGGSDLRNVQIQYIEDSWGQRINFTYQPHSEIRISLPDGGESYLYLSPIGIDSFDDAEKSTTTFEYTTYGESTSLLSTIVYPNGLVSNYDYGPIAFLAPDGSGQSIYAVMDHRQLDSNNNLQQRTNYLFGPYTNCTFTGAAIGLTMGGTSDSLMDAGGEVSSYR